MREFINLDNYEQSKQYNFQGRTHPEKSDKKKIDTTFTLLGKVLRSNCVTRQTNANFAVHDDNERVQINSRYEPKAPTTMEFLINTNYVSTTVRKTFERFCEWLHCSHRRAFYGFLAIVIRNTANVEVSFSILNIKDYAD
ncbi:hypothetical protein GQX74_000347 [Glossina fuscipes]|nr:hypothetical protein GQX74_000347 [Glossina fuscipes]